MNMNINLSQNVVNSNISTNNNGLNIKSVLPGDTNNQYSLTGQVNEFNEEFMNDFNQLSNQLDMNIENNYMNEDQLTNDKRTKK